MAVRHMPAGMMRVYMTVQNPTDSVSATGQLSQSWASETRKLRCVAESHAVADSDIRGGNAVRREFRVVGSWHSGISTRSRLLWDDWGTVRTLEVVSCVDVDGRRKRLEILAVEVVP